MYNVQHVVISLLAVCAGAGDGDGDDAGRTARRRDARRPQWRSGDAQATAGDTANVSLFFLLPLASVRVLRTQPHYAERKA